MSTVSIGHGYDVHALKSGDGLVLGGVTIACEYALEAHSDGDVLVHALCDALLGAMGQGDIGVLFPDTDAANKNRDSREFLRAICTRMEAGRFRLGNADLTIVAQAPKMFPFIESMKQCVASDLHAQAAQINIKATTTEKLGFTGRHEGIAVHAVVLLERDS
jgi:2-C-methyl-D-erythritol 2,4-cyclodiphosphate synthase